MSFLENSLVLHRLQSEISRNREQMLKERCEVNKIKEQNKFLMGVHEDYDRYYYKMAEGKNKYKKQLEKLSNYLEKQLDNAGLSENELAIGQLLKLEKSIRFLIHTVQQGDTLSYISKKYNKKLDELLKENKLTSNIIYIGQELKIEL